MLRPNHALSQWRLIIALILAAAFMPIAAHAKRRAPAKVEPVIYEGVRYTAPNKDGRRAYVQAWTINTNKMLWEVTVFRNFIIPLLEEDTQHVYIKHLSIRDGKLIVTAEDSRAFSVDLKTKAVKKLKEAPPEKTQRSADTNAPAFCFHPEFADMSNRITTPMVLTNSPLLGLPTLQVSNHFSKTGFSWKTNDVALVDTGYKKFPQRSDYVWSRRFILTFAHDKATQVEVYDQPTDCVIMQERKP